ncbi:MAG: preprotein translocase subunit YajC [Sedimentisphaerales bacterium]|nr:preprotein translocase subunit YajC [Sedimentisphaerales bacterium]
MDTMWILAQTEPGSAPSRVGSEPVGQDGAQTTTQAPDSNMPATSTQRPPSLFSPQLLFLVLLFVVMYFMLFRGPRRQQQQQRQMVDTLKKNDRVRTIGGIVGTVVEVREDEVHLKVDEANNTKIWVSKSAIGKSLSEEKKN